MATKIRKANITYAAISTVIAFVSRKARFLGVSDACGEGASPTDYEVEVKFTVKQLAAGLIFAASDHSNYYMWQVNTNGSVRFRPHRWSGGNPSLLSEAAITRVSIKNGEQHKLTVKVTGANTARTYIDDVLIDTRTGDFAYGDFGFREDYDNGSQPEQALFDD